MRKPNITIDGETREMTDDEYAALLETGWTLGETPKERDPNTP